MLFVRYSFAAGKLSYEESLNELMKLHHRATVSQSMTYNQTQVNAPRLKPQPDRPVLDLPVPLDRRLS